MQACTSLATVRGLRILTFDGSLAGPDRGQLSFQTRHFGRDGARLRLEPDHALPQVGDFAVQFEFFIQGASGKILTARRQRLTCLLGQFGLLMFRQSYLAPEITRLEEELCFAASRFDQSLLDVFYDQPHHAVAIGRRRQDFLDSRGIDVASSGK